MGLLTIYALFMVTDVYAQLVRPSNTFFVRPSFGFVNYLGDNNNNLLELGVKGQLEAGYLFSRSLGVSALYNYGEYTDVLRPDINTGLARSTGNTRLSNVQLLVRYTFGKPTWELAPYVHAGGGVAFGGDQVGDEAGWGPVAGLGVDVMVTRNVSFFFEATSNFAVPDEALDGPDRGLFADHDLLTRYSMGLSINFSKGSGFVPVNVGGISGPATLMVGEVGTFSVRGNVSSASEPVTYEWDFGDGEYSPLLTATHSFARPGTYTVTFQAENGQSADMQTHTVIVGRPDNAPEILAMNSNPVNPDVTTAITFDATVVGSDPITYDWDFGDGVTSEDPFPSRVFNEPGFYEVTLRVSNSEGSDQQSIQLNIGQIEAVYCEEIENTSLSPVYFGRQSSFLSVMARTTLDDNLRILQDCPNINVRVEAFAVSGERDTDNLAADRARAVEDFYADNGISRGRIVAVGLGVVEGFKKDGAELYRKAESVIIE